MNDKIIGMLCITVMFLAVLGVQAYTQAPMDPVVKEIALPIITGIMGTVVGISYKARK